MNQGILTHEKFQKLLNELPNNNDFLNVKNEREFFLNAHLLFEDLLMKVTINNHIEDVYSQQLNALRNAFYDLPCIEYLYEFLSKLNKYRNEVAHNKYPKIDIKEIREEISLNIQSIFRCAFSLYDNEELTDELIKNKILSISLPKNEVSPLQNYVGELVEEAKNIDDNILINSYDEYLYHAILLIHSLISGGLNGVMFGQEANHNSK